jgi:hypothetical protein
VRLALGVLAAGAAVLAMAGRRPSGHHPSQPRYPADQRSRSSARGDEPAAQEQPSRPSQQSPESRHDARERECDARDAKHQRIERRFWALGLLVSAGAAAATGFAAWFAYWAYDAALQSVVAAQETVAETRRQANIAQDALVASTRARLKITSITGISAIRAEDSPAAWFHFKPAYRNFGQTPAQDISFLPHVFVVGSRDGPSPKRACEEDKSRFRMPFTEIVFPQEEADDPGIGIQIALRELRRKPPRSRPSNRPGRSTSGS